MLQLDHPGMLSTLGMLRMLCPHSTRGRRPLSLVSSLGSLTFPPCYNSRGFRHTCPCPTWGTLHPSSLSRQACSSTTGLLPCITCLQCCKTRTSLGHRHMGGLNPKPLLPSSTGHHRLSAGHSTSTHHRHSRDRSGRAVLALIGSPVLEWWISNLEDLLHLLVSGSCLPKQTWVTSRRPVWRWTHPQTQGRVLLGSVGPLRDPPKPLARPLHLLVQAQSTYTSPRTSIRSRFL